MRRASRALLAAATSLLLASCIDEERNWFEVMGGQPAAPENTAPEPGPGTGGSGGEPTWPLRAGPNGAWVQGTWAVEQGARTSELLGPKR